MAEKPDTTQFEIGTMQIRLQNVQLRSDVILDDVVLESGDVHIAGAEVDAGGGVTVSASETKFQITMSEPHINEFLTASLPADAALRNVHLAFLSGKVRVTGQVVKSVLHFPVTLDAVLLIENGVRIKLDCQAATFVIPIPAVVLELFEMHINNNPKLPLDLSKLPVPVRLDEIRCEPGRLKVSGRARLQWPLAVGPQSIAPFSARETPAYLLPDADVAMELPAGDDPGVSSALPV